MFPNSSRNQLWMEKVTRKEEAMKVNLKKKMIKMMKLMMMKMIKGMFKTKKDKQKEEQE